MNPAVDLWSNIIAMELPSSHIPSLLEPFNSDGMCEDDSSMAIMLDHRSTALGRDFNSQVLKHRGILDFEKVDNTPY